MKLLPSDPDIQTIVARIDSGDLDLQPNFQRGEVWATSKKKKLIDSILRDWHVPPIHVVVGDAGKQEVLDGQQRLVAIRDFVEGKFRIDGRSEPSDPSILKLDGLKYSDLPSEVKRAFDQFTIRMFRLVDYRPGEPGELFFRLNQMTYLTAAEQRNAFFGPVREQVRFLVGVLESTNVIGFSNRRMAYDDVLAKLLCTLEIGTLREKLGATEISDRFRASEPFSDHLMKLANDTVVFFTETLAIAPIKPRFNKATLFTWLVFSTYFVRSAGKPAFVANFIWDFENQRTKSVHTMAEFRQSLATKLPSVTERSLLRIFSDRSSSRVSDVSSVILRDLIVWIFFFDSFRQDARVVLPAAKAHQLEKLHAELMVGKESTEETLEESAQLAFWGDLR
jgi:hypothetical protein